MAIAQAGEWPAAIDPRLVPLAEPLAYRWTARLPSEDARLAPMDGGLWLTFADGRVLELRASGPPAFDAPPALPPGGFRPAYASDPVYVTDGGEVGRWAPERGWSPVWSTGLPGTAVDAFGMPGARLLMSSSQWPDATRLLDEEAGGVVWSLALVSPRMLVTDQVALGWQAGRLHAIDAAGGRLLWRREGVRSVAALSATAAWLAGESGALSEVDAASGAPAAERELPGGIPSFALAPDGRLHAVARPLEALVLDLLDGLRVVADRSYRGAVVRGNPWVVALAAGSRLVVATADAVLALAPERDGDVHELWRTDELIVDAAAAGGQLGVVTLDGAGDRFLTLFGG